jgi:hypothetical protein
MKKLLTFFLASSPLAAFAHGGHGIFDGNALMHYFASPEHAIPVAGIVLTVGIILFRRHRKAAAEKARR